MVPREGFEPSITRLRGGSLRPLGYRGVLADPQGIEPCLTRVNSAAHSPEVLEVNGFLLR